MQKLLEGIERPGLTKKRDELAFLVDKVIKTSTGHPQLCRFCIRLEDQADDPLGKVDLKLQVKLFEHQRLLGWWQHKIHPKRTHRSVIAYDIPESFMVYIKNVKILVKTTIYVAAYKTSQEIRELHT